MTDQPDQPQERTLTAYQCFFRESFAELKVKVQAEKGGEKWTSNDTQKVVKQVGERWRSMSKEEKAKWRVMLSKASWSTCCGRQLNQQ